MRSQGYLYIRGEYPEAEARIRDAIAAARAAGLLGADILGSGFAFDIEVRRGAGAYICGEETALFESIEGKRGEPRNKPPFPVEVGLFGKPTVVNNVETLANVPLILAMGGEAYAADRDGGLDRPEAVLPVRPRRSGPASTRSSSGRRSGDLIEHGRWRPGRPGDQGDPARRRGGRLRRPRRRSICRSRSRRRAPPARRSGRA